MSQVIVWELQFLLKALILGLCLRGTYDVFKVRRGLTKKHPALMASEDIVYWVFCSLFLFGLLYEENNGTLRSFALCGVAVGMAIWHFGPSPILVAGAIGILRVVGKILKKPVKICGKALKKMKAWFRMKIKYGERRSKREKKNDSKRAQKKKTIQ